jgi:hypothetical protein
MSFRNDFLNNRTRARPQNCKIFLIFYPKINVTTFYHIPPPVISRFISDRLFSFPQVENEVKNLHFADVVKIPEAITDELNKV